MFDLLFETHLIDNLQSIVIIDPRQQFSRHFKELVKKYNCSRDLHTDVRYYVNEKEMDYTFLESIREKNLNQFYKSKSNNVHFWKDKHCFSLSSKKSELNSNKITKFVPHYFRLRSSHTRKIYNNEYWMVRHILLMLFYLVKYL